MKVLSLKEPYATLIKENKKLIETRSWHTSYRGELYIHASLCKVKKDHPELLKLIDNNDFDYGCIICKCELVDCIKMDKELISRIKLNKVEYLCGQYEIGRYAWILKNVKIVKPIPVKGHLGIWTYNLGDE